MLSHEIAAPVKRRFRFLKWLGVLTLLVVLPPLLWFVNQVTIAYRDIQGGRGVSVKDRRFNMSVSKAMANTQVSRAELTRLAPTTLAPELGSKTARLTVVEFIDYQCPFCQRSAAPLREVMAAMGDRVRLLVRDFPILELHPTAKDSALAANCVLEQGQTSYWRFHDLIFADQAKQAAEDLRAKAALSGVKLADYDSCVAGRRYDNKIDQDYALGLQVGVRGTPTFFVNGVKFEGALDAQALIRILNAFLDRLPK